jgi:hypothetical protein
LASSLGQRTISERLTNFGGSQVTGPFQVLLTALQWGQSLISAALATPGGKIVPVAIYYTVGGDTVVSIPDGVLPSLQAGASFQLELLFDNNNPFNLPLDYAVQVAIGAL